MLAQLLGGHLVQEGILHRAWVQVSAVNHEVEDSNDRYSQKLLLSNLIHFMKLLRSLLLHVFLQLLLGHILVPLLDHFFLCDGQTLLYSFFNFDQVTHLLVGVLGVLDFDRSLALWERQEKDFGFQVEIDS